MNIIGRTIANRYEIINKTGVGGMATVYVAKDKVLNRNVAVKVLKDEFTTDEEFVKRFEVEAQSAASITHPNIVSVYDVGHEGNLYYIVMELVKGKTLIVVAHRLATIQNADQILVVENGKIVGCGGQEELLLKCPLYQRLWSDYVSSADQVEGGKV